MDDAVTFDVVEQGLLEEGVVVAVVDRARAREEVDVLGAVFADQARAAGRVKHGGKRADVTADLRFPLLKTSKTHGTPISEGST